jgi:hypothetical protein
MNTLYLWPDDFSPSEKMRSILGYSLWSRTCVPHFVRSAAGMPAVVVASYPQRHHAAQEGVRKPVAELGLRMSCR